MFGRTQSARMEPARARAYSISGQILLSWMNQYEYEIQIIINKKAIKKCPNESSRRGGERRSRNMIFLLLYLASNEMSWLASDQTMCARMAQVETNRRRIKNESAHFSQMYFNDGNLGDSTTICRRTLNGQIIVDENDFCSILRASRHVRVHRTWRKRTFERLQLYILTNESSSGQHD